jgi:predicted outer membrane protein
MSKQREGIEDMKSIRASGWLAAAAVTCFATAGCTTMEAQIQSSGSMGSVDTQYVNTAFDLIQLDHEEGKLVASKTQDPRIVDLSSKIVAQADALSPGLTAAANVAGATPPATLTPDLAARVARLQGLSGPAFDRQYVADELSVHKRALEVFHAEDTSTKDDALRNQVETELPAVQGNLDSLTVLSAEYNPTASSS